METPSLTHLYPRQRVDEHDACAIVASIRTSGEATHGNLKRIIEALSQMGHRSGDVQSEGGRLRRAHRHSAQPVGYRARRGRAARVAVRRQALLRRASDDSQRAARARSTMAGARVGSHRRKWRRPAVGVSRGNAPPGVGPVGVGAGTALTVRSTRSSACANRPRCWGRSWWTAAATHRTSTGCSKPSSTATALR